MPVVRNSICGFMETTGIPTLSIQNYRGKLFLEQDVQHRSKLTGAGAFEFRPMANNETWRALMEAYWDIGMATINCVPMPAGFPDWMHGHTRGFPRFACQLADSVFRHAVANEPAPVEAELLARHASVVLAPYAEALSVLGKYDREKELPSYNDFIRYEELLPPDLREQIVKGASKEAPAKTPRTPAKRSSKAGRRDAAKRHGRQTEQKGDNGLMERLDVQGVVVHGPTPTQALDDEATSNSEPHSE